ncbi:uncharacterized protein LOC123401710 [Hordeum vulgare subsp. vulgare]|uniref:Predicted protein n=1 Tax=Hordeum vulgare subsp. vulgare TaxID=112509 RepID=F2EEP9_HORVV|nr:uncharacterized protein LOC123401710 [Hordeum vulgare subsp. vulgare]BAK05821.1 predicted protein [Hordeum vulgare subsp. vulgare]
MDGGKKQGRDDRKASSQVRSDRKSGSGMSGDAKKGGRGGKFTWEGADGYTDEDLDLVATKAAGASSSGKNKS